MAPLLHGVALTRARRRDYARFVWALFRGKSVENVPGTVAFTGTSVTAEGAGALPVQADGDIVATLPVRIALRADPLSFC
jgi:hypothetical protein